MPELFSFCGKIKLRYAIFFENIILIVVDWVLDK